MIFYFTGTGNSEQLAKEIAAKTGDRVINITEAVRSKKYSYTVSEGENLGFSMPVYFSGVPHIVKEFLEKADFTLKGENYVFSALTCGAVTSDTGKMLSKLLLKKGVRTDAEYGITMVDNYIYMYGISDEKGARAKLKQAESEIEKIVSSVMNKEKGNLNSVHGPSFMSYLMYPMYTLFRRTKPFYVKDNCISCGKCERECPEEAIELINGKPVWVKSKCTHCVRCIHSCPVKAIEMGKGTEKRNRYMNPYV